MVRDDCDDPFDNILDEIERAMNDVTGGDAGLASETHIDMYDEGSTFRPVASLSGVDKDTINLKCDDGTLTISTAGDRREHDERIRLPVRVGGHFVSAMFNNGVLQVTLDRVEDSVAIDVE